MFSNCSKSSGSDHTFNFQYEIEIKTLKSKTSELNQKLDFNDFPDFRQDRSDSRTISQTNKKHTGDSFFVISNPSERNLRSTWTQNVSNKRGINWQHQQQLNSPKFTLNEEESKVQIEISSKKLENEMLQENKQNLAKKSESDVLVKNEENSVIDEQRQFMECERKIRYLKSNNEMLEYEEIKIQKQIEMLQKILEQGKLREQVSQIYRQTQKINERICKQKKLENALIFKKDEISNSFANLSRNLNLMNFQRPSLIKDEASALLQQINQLKMEYQQNTNSLTQVDLDTQRPLSNAPSIQRNCGSQRSTKHQGEDPERLIFEQIKNEIKKSALSCSDTNFIRNIKYSIIKEQWQLFQNSDIAVNYSSRRYPKIEAVILNKSRFFLEELKISENGILLKEKSSLQSKKCDKYQIDVTGLNVPFKQITISYMIQECTEVIKLFLPTLPLKFGEFLPITSNQFDYEYQLHKNSLESIISPRRVQLDSQLFPTQNISEISSYIPNLISEAHQSRGVFQLIHKNQGALVMIKSYEDLSFQVQVLNRIPYLLGSLEFFIGAI